MDIYTSKLFHLIHLSSYVSYFLTNSGKLMESCCSLNTLSPCVNLRMLKVGTTQAVPRFNSKSIRLEGYKEPPVTPTFPPKIAPEIALKPTAIIKGAS